MARKVLADLDFGSVSKITNLPDGVNAGDAVNVSQLNSAVEGVSWKDSARVSTISNINLSAPGASIDGITMAAGDRVLVKEQTTAATNGIYVWNGAAVAMSRALDANTFPELEQAVITVEEGTNAGSTFRQTAVNGTLEVTAIAFTAFGTVAPPASTTTAGIAEIATQAEVDTGTDAVRYVTPQTLAGYANRKLKYAANFGDGAATQYDITHNLNTKDLTYCVSRVASPYDVVDCELEFLTVNAVRIRMSSAPTANQYRVVLIG